MSSLPTYPHIDTNHSVQRQSSQPSLSSISSTPAARSSSGVRSLRAYFENKKGDPDRFASSDSLHKENRPPSSSIPRKVRASFYSVRPRSRQTMEQSKHSTSASARRESFSMSEYQDQAAISSIKKTVSEEKERRQSIAPTAEPIPEVAAFSAEPTPLTELSSPPLPAAVSVMKEPEDDQTEHTEKSISAVEDQSAAMTAADPTDPRAVEAVTSDSATKPKAQSNGVATKPKISRTTAGPSKTNPTEEARHNGKLSEKAKNVTDRLTSTHKAPRASIGSQHTSPPPKQRTSVPLSSRLTAPTAASIARQQDAHTRPDEPAIAKRGVASGAVSSRLTAPTAASAARSERVSDGKSEPTRPRQSLAAASSKSVSHPRQSLPARTSKLAEAKAPPKKTTSDFLSRISRPNKAAEPSKETSKASSAGVAKVANGAAKKLTPAQASKTDSNTQKTPRLKSESDIAQPMDDIRTELEDSSSPDQRLETQADPSMDTLDEKDSVQLDTSAIKTTDEALEKGSAKPLSTAMDTAQSDSYENAAAQTTSIVEPATEAPASAEQSPQAMKATEAADVEVMPGSTSAVEPADSSERNPASLLSPASKTKDSVQADVSSSPAETTAPALAALTSSKHADEAFGRAESSTPPGGSAPGLQTSAVSDEESSK